MVNDALTPDVVQDPGVVVQAEQQRADHRAGLVPAEAGHHRVRGAGVLDLEHQPLARLVRQVGRLDDQPVQPGALEHVEPATRGVRVGGDLGDVHRRPHPGQRLDQPLPTASGRAGRAGPRRRSPAGRTRRSRPGWSRPASSPGRRPGGRAGPAARSPAGAGRPARRAGSRSARRRPRSAPAAAGVPARPPRGSSGSSILPPRLANSTSSPSRNTMHRNPSHLGS